MDIEILQRHLVQAEYHAAESMRLVAQQEELVAGLKQRGLGTADAAKVLDALRDAQTVHEQDIQFLRTKLGFT